ncbi:hypothetical protein AMTRI_Chr04g183360 [Amborella trichopoda]
MITPSKAPVCLLSSLDFDLNFVHNSRNNQKPNLWFFWKNIIKAPNVIVYESVLFSIIHSQTSLVKRRILWEELKNLSCNYDIPWVIMGDFNAILLSSEKAGGNPPNRTSCDEFANFVNSLDFIQPTHECMRYSWTNNRKVLQRISSDHSPIILQSCPMPKARNIMFRFQHVWTEHLEFLEVVKEVWKQQIT